jgi:hypothetical protein
MSYKFGDSLTTTDCFILLVLLTSALTLSLGLMVVDDTFCQKASRPDWCGRISQPPKQQPQK